MDDEQRYSQILETLIPKISNFVDAQDGVCSISLLMQDPELKALVNEIPNSKEKKITKILANYLDFFALLEGGNIATHKGYENGLVDANNNILKAGKNAAKNKSKAWAGSQYVAMPSAGDPPSNLDNDDPFASTSAKAKVERVQMDQVFTDEDGNEIDLTKAVDDLTRFVFAEEETENFYDALTKLRVVRNRTFQIDDTAEWEKFVAKFSPAPQQQQQQNFVQQRGGTQRYQPIQAQKRTIGSVDDGTAIPGSVPGGPATKTQKLYGRDRLERQQLIIRELVTMLSIWPNKQMTVVRLCQQPKIMALKKGVILKFTTFIDENADKFKRQKDPINPLNAPEIIELSMDESEANQLLYDTQELHDRYVIEHPELMVDLPEPPGPGPAAKAKSGYRAKGFGKGGGKGYNSNKGGGYGTGANWYGTGANGGYIGQGMGTIGGMAGMAGMF